MDYIILIYLNTLSNILYRSKIILKKYYDNKELGVFFAIDKGLQ